MNTFFQQKYGSRLCSCNWNECQSQVSKGSGWPCHPERERTRTWASFFVAGPKTEFGIHHRLELCVVLLAWPNMTSGPFHFWRMSGAAWLCGPSWRRVRLLQTCSQEAQTLWRFQPLWPPGDVLSLVCDKSRRSLLGHRSVHPWVPDSQERTAWGQAVTCRWPGLGEKWKSSCCWPVGLVTT